MSAPDPTRTPDDGEGLVELLAAHEPVLGHSSFGTAVLGCSCLSMRDYRAAGFKGGQAGYREHLATILAARDRRVRAEGAAEAWVDLDERLQHAAETLIELRDNAEGMEEVRLDGKLQGVLLALSYVDEANRIATPEAQHTEWCATRNLESCDCNHLTPGAQS